MIYILCYRGREGLLFKGVMANVVVAAYSLYVHQLDGGDGLIYAYDTETHDMSIFEFAQHAQIFREVENMVRRPEDV